MSIRHMVLLPRPPPTAVTSVAMFGDSIVAQMAPLQSGLASPINAAANYGVSGQVASEITQRAAAVVGHSHVFIEGGTNNFLLGLGPDGIVPAYQAAIEMLCDSVVVVVGVPHVHESLIGVAYQGLISNAAIAQVNAHLVALCAGYINCRPAVSAMNMDMTGKTVDGIHLQAGAYAEWSSLLASAI